MDQFYKDLVEKIRYAAEKDIQKIMGETGGEKIYAAALVTDSDCVTLFLAVNTLEYLKDNGGLESEDRWLPDEWGYSDESGSELSKLSRLLFEHDRAISSDGYTDEEWEQNRRQFFEAAVAAFVRLKAGNVFGEQTKEVTCFVSISDDDRAEDGENWSAQLLNTPELASAFVDRYQQ